MKMEAEEHKNLVNEQEKNSDVGTSSNMKQISDVYLRHPANESSSDSEGEEDEFDGKFSLFSVTVL